MPSLSALAIPATGVLAIVALVAIGPPGSHNGPPLAPYQLSVMAGAGEAATAEAAAPAPTARPPRTVEAAGVTLTSVDVSLPMSDRTFPDGPHADAINTNCVACHSAGMVLNQPSLKRAEWQAEVNKMRNTYKAPVSDADAAAIVDYLASTKGL